MSKVKFFEKVRSAKQGLELHRLAENNIPLIRDIIIADSYDEEEFNLLNEIIQSLYKNDKIELVFILFESINFERIANFDSKFDFSQVWFKSLLQKRKLGAISKNSGALLEILDRDKDIVIQLVKIAKDQSTSAVNRVLKGASILFTILLAASIISGLHNIYFIYSIFILIMLIKYLGFIQIPSFVSTRGVRNFMIVESFISISLFFFIHFLREVDGESPDLLLLGFPLLSIASYTFLEA